MIAITLCLGLIIGPTDATPGRRAIGAVIVGAYLLLVLANFAFMYPVLTAAGDCRTTFWRPADVVQQLDLSADCAGRWQALGDRARMTAALMRRPTRVLGY